MATIEPNNASSEGPVGSAPSKATGEQAREGAFTGSATQPSVVNSPLPGEDAHRPFDMTTLRQVLKIDPSDLVIIKNESGRLEFLSKDTVDSRLATPTEKAVFRMAPSGTLVEAYDTDKGLIVVDPKGNRLVTAQQRDNYTKV